MEKEDLKQIGEIVEKVVDKRISQAEVRINKHTNQKIDEKIDGLAIIVNKSFGKLEKRVDGLEGRFDGLEGRFDGLEGRFDGLEEKVDDNSMALDRIERQMRAESETLDKHDARLKILEKTRY